MQTQTDDVIEGRYEVRGEPETRNGVELCEAYDRQLDRPVLIQRLTPDAAADKERARRFLRSQQLAAPVHNCPILSVYDAGVDAGRPFSVMEKRKDGSPADLARPGYPPNVPAALKVTRQAAEALRCCRESGLVDWTFSPDAVCVDGDGNAHLAVIEGLDGPHSSAKPSADARALGGVLIRALFGRADSQATPAELAMLPPAVRELVGRLTESRKATLWTADDVEKGVAAIESASSQPTQAYMPVVAADAHPAPVHSRRTVPNHDAPTLAAAVAPAESLARPYESGQPYAQVEKAPAGDDPKTQAL